MDEKVVAAVKSGVRGRQHAEPHKRSERERRLVEKSVATYDLELDCLAL